jgi:predicted ATPase
MDLLLQVIPELAVLSKPFSPRGSVVMGAGTKSDKAHARAPSDRSCYSKLEMANARAASDRLCYSFRALVNIISSFTPLVFLCDDVQWADKASINLLQGFITDDQNPALMLLWTYRSNLVDTEHTVSRAIQNIQTVARDRAIVVKPISVGALSELHVQALIADILDVSTLDQVADLTTILYKKTHGNVFFCIQYLLSLAQKSLLTFDMGSSKWCWDLDRVREGLTATDNVVDLMKDKLQQCPAARTILPLAACIGATFESCVLQELLKGIRAAEDPATTELFSSILGSNYRQEMAEEDLLRRSENDGLIEAIGQSSYAFIHDKVIEAALALVGDEKIDTLKFHLGCILFERMSDFEELRADQIAFLVVNLLNSRLDMIPEAQKLAVFTINVTAGDEAYLSAAYRRAAMYYTAAISLLPENHWETMYAESLRLHTFAAQVEMCLGNYDEMKAYIDVVLQQDLPLLDTLPIHQVQVEALGQNQELIEAWTECSKVLKKTGCEVPETYVSTRTTLALTKIKMNKKAFQPAALSKLPINEDPLEEEISKFYNQLILFSVWVSSVFGGNLLDWHRVHFDSIRLTQRFFHTAVQPWCNASNNHFGLQAGP